MIGDLQNLLQEHLDGLGIKDVHPIVTPTSDPTHGDYATNVAFVLSKKLGKSPMDAAGVLAESLVKDLPPILEKVEVARPGFINLTLSNAFLLERLQNIIAQDYSSSEPSDDSESRSSRRVSLARTISIYSGQKIMIEFTDPNPFKEFHIGHLYSNIVGESLARLLESQGAEVRRVNYQGDVGLHVAKALYGLRQKMHDSGFMIQEIEKKSLKEKAKLLGEAYALGATKYEEDEQAKQEIIALNKKVYQVLEENRYSSSDPELDEGESRRRFSTSSNNTTEVKELYEKGRQWSLDYFETIYQRLMNRESQKAFDRYYFESEAGPVGLELVKEYLTMGVFEESQGAVIFPGEKHGLHNRVFINSLGLPTYEAKELGLAITKSKEYQYDQSIIITGNEIDEYFRVLLKALSLIRPDLAEKTKHLSHGMVRLPEGKMSSRTGKVLTGEWLMNEAKSRAAAKIREVKGEGEGRVSEELEEQVSEMVGIGAVKYALLRSSIGRDIEFSFDESVSFEGNAGPYLQYTYVRTQSVLEKSKIKNQKSKSEESSLVEAEKEGLRSGHPALDAGSRLLDSGSRAGMTIGDEERELLILLNKYSDVVTEAAQKYAPSTLCTYLFDLAQVFNLFYQKHPILKPSPVISIEVERSLNEKSMGQDFSSPSAPRNDTLNEDAIRSFRLALTEAVGKTMKEGLELLGIQAPERM